MVVPPEMLGILVPYLASNKNLGATGMVNERPRPQSSSSPPPQRRGGGGRREDRRVGSCILLLLVPPVPEAREVLVAARPDTDEVEASSLDASMVEVDE